MSKKSIGRLNGKCIERNKVMRLSISETGDMFPWVGQVNQWLSLQKWLGYRKSFNHSN